MRPLLVVAALLAMVPVGVALLIWRGGARGGIDDAYRLAFGPADQGSVDFASLTRRSTPNDALACAPDVCLRARADLVPPVYAVSAERLRAVVAQVAREDANTGLAYSGPMRDRYVARSPLMRFPDTVDVMIVPRGEDRSTLALYSRSQIGRSDLGANRARLEHWLTRIGERVPVSEAASHP